MSYFLAKFFQVFVFFSFVIRVYEADIKPSEDAAQEIQHAVCNVFTKEIEASAKATITRQLKGVCSTKEVNRKLEKLQATIFRELQDIKKALGLKYTLRYTPVSTSTSLPSTTSSTSAPSTYEDLDYLEPEEDTTKKYVNFKNLEHINGKDNYILDDVRVNDEILMYNDTLVESSEGDLYFYYWKIPEIGRVLKKRNVYISSPPFSVLGHTLHLQFYPNYLDDYVGILLKPESNSFLKKHKIIFLGQTRTQNQISSKILYGIKNEDKIFKIEPEMLDKNFILGDSLLVKVKIYISS